MGSCTSSPLMTKQSGSVMNLPVTKVAMVIQMNGKLQEFRQPITAGEILVQNPDFFLCSSEAMNVNSLVPQLAKDEILQLVDGSSRILTRRFKKMHDCHAKDLNLRSKVFESSLPLQ